MREVLAAPWALECEGKGGRSSAPRVYVYIYIGQFGRSKKSTTGFCVLWESISISSGSRKAPTKHLTLNCRCVRINSGGPGSPGQATHFPTLARWLSPLSISPTPRQKYPPPRAPLFSLSAHARAFASQDLRTPNRITLPAGLVFQLLFFVHFASSHSRE